MGAFFFQLRKAIIDHISDSFLDTTVPLLVLTEAAKNGREAEIKEYATIFKEHTCRLIEVGLILMQDINDINEYEMRSAFFKKYLIFLFMF